MAPVLSLVPSVPLATLGTTDIVARGRKDGLDVDVDGTALVSLAEIKRSVLLLKMPLSKQLSSMEMEHW